MGIRVGGGERQYGSSGKEGVFQVNTACKYAPITTLRILIGLVALNLTFTSQDAMGTRKGAFIRIGYWWDWLCKRTSC